jgi:hypothetical protein
MGRARRTKGRVVESAGIRTQRTLSHPRPKLGTRGVARVVADDAPRRFAWAWNESSFVSNQPFCRDAYERLNKWAFSAYAN